MAIGDIKEYNDKKYIAVKESVCAGCALYSSEEGCEAVKTKSDMDSNCYENQSIWKEYDVNNKYTVEEVVDCLINANWISKSSRDEAIESVNMRIKLITDPDYKIFLQLKEKFKDL